MVTGHGTAAFALGGEVGHDAYRAVLAWVRDDEVVARLSRTVGH